MENNKPEEKKNNDKMNKILLGILTTILTISLLAVSYFLFFYEKEDTEETKLAYTDLIKQVTDGEIEKIEMTVGSSSVKVKQKNIEEEKTAIVPNTQAFIELIQDKVCFQL